MNRYKYEDAPTDARAWYEDAEERRRLYLMGNADCCHCGRLIEEEECVVVYDDDPMGTAFCPHCEEVFRKEVREADIAQEWKNWIFDVVADLKRDTPHEAWKEGE